MAEDQDKPERSFKVQDRRRFTETGETRTEEAGREEARPEEKRTEAPAGPGPAVPVGDPRATAQSQEPFEINFAAFVISLSTQALAHLGEMLSPVDGTMRVDLEAARQIIDIIAMLRDKTKGNLDDAESALLDDALYDLRMKYVERAHGR